MCLGDIMIFFSHPGGSGAPYPPRQKAQGAITQNIESGGTLGIGPARTTNIGKGTEDGSTHEKIHDDEPQGPTGGDIFGYRAFAFTAGKRAQEKDEKQINKNTRLISMAAVPKSTIKKENKTILINWSQG